MSRLGKTIYVKEEAIDMVDEMLLQIMRDHPEWAFDYDTEWDRDIAAQEEEE